MKQYLLVASTCAFVLALGVVGASSQQSPSTPMQQQDQPHQADREGTMLRHMMHEGEMMGHGMMGGGMMGHQGMMGFPIMRIMFALMDTDSDGTVSLQEFQTAHERIFKAMDANKDGRLTFDEMRAFIQGANRPQE
jgi:hypothetical protein